MTSDESHNSLLRWAQWLIIVAAIAGGGGRILSAAKPGEDAPLFSANDRSRWATIQALVDYRTFAIDNIISRAGRRTKWHTIDLVQHRDRDNQQRFYSSKPPLLPTLVAVQYAFLAQAGLSLEANTNTVIRFLLLTTNLAPFLVYLLAAQRLINELASHSATKLFVLASVAFGTLLSPFLITLNNHLPAAFAVMLTMVFVYEILNRERPPLWLFPPVGLFAAFAVTNELPALAFFCLTAMIVGRKSPAKTVLGFAPAAGVVAAAFFGLNFIAHDHFIPPYAHRKDGAEVGRINERFRDQLRVGRLMSEELAALAPFTGEETLQGAMCFRASDKRWSIQLHKTQQRFAILDDAQEGLSVRAWGNWYDYPGSYWLTEKRGVDRGEPNRFVYFFHVFFGHHGIFSLSPIWLLAVIGGWVMLSKGGGQQRIAMCILSLSVIVLGFYIARPEIDRNYGGVSCAFRWSLWLIPLWIVPLIAGADSMLKRNSTSLISLLFLGVSIGSVYYAAANPWSHPWIFQLLSAIGWIHYP